MILRRTRRSRGQSLVEFALIAPLLFALVFVIIELGIVLSAYIGLTNSAREGARAGAIYQYDGSLVNPSAEDIDPLRESYIIATYQATLNPIINPTRVEDEIAYKPTTRLPAGVPNPHRAGETIELELKYEHPLFFGLLGPSQIVITSHSSMRIETGGKEPE